MVSGKLTKENLKGIADVNGREIAIFVPMIVVVMLLGIYPEAFLAPIRASVENLIVQASGVIDPASAIAMIQR